VKVAERCKLFVQEMSPGGKRGVRLGSVSSFYFIESFGGYVRGLPLDIRLVT
jgi:hypothetical protein